MITVSHPTGNQNVRAVLGAFERARLLDCFVTTIAFSPTGLWPSILPGRLVQELMRRAYPDIPRNRIATAPLRETVRLVAGRLPPSGLKRCLTNLASIDRIYVETDRRVARAIDNGRIRSRCIYAYEDGAASSFAAAARRGLLRLYDLPIGYWRSARRLFEEEKALQPAWAGTLELLEASPEKLERKDEELGLANRIFVASNFTRTSLGEFPGALPDIQFVPYGAPPRACRRSPHDPRGPLKVLFVGSLGQRKGISYLFEAMNKLDRAATLTLVGPKPVEPCRALEEGLERFAWQPPVSHDDVLSLMSQHDVLVFPTLFEGFGLVILEAMSQGLPVIATPHCAGPELIVDGREGFIVPIRDPDAIAERLSWLADDRDRLAAMSAAAVRRAREYSWEAYGAAMVDAVKPFVAP